MIKPMIGSSISVLASGLRFPEGPAFSADGGLWAVELLGESIVHYKKGVLKSLSVGGKPNGIAFDKAGEIWFCDAGQNSVRSLDPKTGITEIRVDNIDGQTLDGPNDLAFDDRGNLIFTCPGSSRKEPTGYVCALMRDGTVKKIASGMYFPNGLAFSLSGKELVIAETYKHRLWKGKWDSERCEWTDAEVFSETGGPVGPDGMAFHPAGNLYVAVYGSGAVKMIDTGGKIINEISLPGNNPTNCAFDPSGDLGLVVTEAENGLLISVK